MHTMEEARERQEAELEFVSSAYSPDEAWTTTSSSTDDKAVSVVHRRLDLEFPSSAAVTIQLSMQLPNLYPNDEALFVDASVIDSNASTSSALKAAYNALPAFTASCRSVASQNIGEESIFLVMSHSEQWIEEEWPKFCKGDDTQSTPTESNSPDVSTKQKNLHTNQRSMLGRRLIYSHHIISKIKRRDIKRLASDLSLTGYMKVGWPGILIIEGMEEDCIRFYDEIRPWQWQYLVVRGEQQESIPMGMMVDSMRKFQDFQEVESMSIVAQHCQQVGLEALFRTSMKVYDNGNDGDDKQLREQSTWYGALVLVDHMNNGKAYRKWLRKTSQDTDCQLMIKQTFSKDDYSQRPTIIVAVIGPARDNVSSFLKRWRTSRVDVDSKGIPCLERQMSVLVENDLSQLEPSQLEWQSLDSEEALNIPQATLEALVSSIGGDHWLGSLPKQE